MITFSSSIKLLKEPGGYYFEAKLQQALAARAEQISIYDGTYSILKQHATTLFELWQKAILALDRAETLTSQTNDNKTFESVLNAISIERHNFKNTQISIGASVKAS